MLGESVGADHEGYPGLDEEFGGVPSQSKNCYLIQRESIGRRKRNANKAL